MALTLADLAGFTRTFTADLGDGVVVVMRKLSNAEACEVRRHFTAPPVPTRPMPGKGSEAVHVPNDSDPEYLRKDAEYQGTLSAADFAVATGYVTGGELEWPGLAPDKDAFQRRDAYLKAAVAEISVAIPRGALGLAYQLAHGIVRPKEVETKADDEEKERLGNSSGPSPSA